MIRKIKNLGLICAKKNSSELKNKNLRKIGKHSLFEIACLDFSQSKLVDRVVVSTDSSRIINLSKQYKFTYPLIRPKKLSQKSSPEWLVWQHALNKFRSIFGYLPKALVVCSCTAPLRDPKIIDLAIKKFYKLKKDAVVSVCKTNFHPSFNMVKLSKNRNNVQLFLKDKPVFNRQQTSDIFTITTNIYVLKPEFVLKNDHLFSSKNIGYVEISKLSSLDIDDNFDYLLAKKNFDEKYS